MGLNHYLAGFVVAVSLIGAPAMAVEEPGFETVVSDGAFEVRDYPSLIVAEVTVSGEQREAANAGFRLLAAYIFGGNTTKASIAMTAPVAQEPAGEKIAMTAPVTQTPSAGEWVQLGLRVATPLSRERELIGDVAVGTDATQPDTYELGVTLSPDHQGHGYATEALTTVIDWLVRECGAHRIHMQGDSRNDAVLTLMRRMGLRYEGAVLEGDWFKGEWTTLERFALLGREWLERRD